MSEPGWRIDDLAHRAGVTVDTIRYYAREGLLPPPERSGRHKLYGPRHLDRLERIRELQHQRFSLAAIRALLDSDRPGLEHVFAESGPTYDIDALAELSGLDRTLVESLQQTGLLPRPEEFGRDAYDATDLGLLEAVRALLEIGMPADLLVELSAVYVEHFERLQADVIELFATGGRSSLPDDELEVVQRALTANAGRMIPAVDRVLTYVHQRTLERMTLDAMDRATREGRGLGGIRTRDDGSPGTTP